MRQPRNVAPKPFVWVDLPDNVDRRQPSGHDRWGGDYTGTLECTLTLLTPLHVGSGLFCLTDGKVVKEAVRQSGQLIIPGSSLKGAFRSIAEAISASCVSKTRQSVPPILRECCDLERLCACCRLFGGLGYLGRVRFADAMLSVNGGSEIQNVPALWRPRRSRQGRKIYKHGQPATGNEPFEVLSKGAQFDFRVDIESLTKPELCLLLTAMGILGDLKLKLGGAKPRCLGSVQVALRQARLWTPQDAAISYDRNIITLNSAQLLQQVEQSVSLIDQAALNRVRSILVYSESEKCPSELY